MDMEIIFIIASLLLSIGISLGVGSSTIAIINFFAAIADGIIDPTERRMMGVTYIMLRVAMVVIALTLLTHYMIGYVGFNTPLYGSTHAVAMGIVTVILYSNALAMTYRLMPSTFGPAIQASSWYTLGGLSALLTLDVTNFSIVVFLVAYLTMFTLFLCVVNGVMAWLRHRQLAQHPH